MSRFSDSPPNDSPLNQLQAGYEARGHHKEDRRGSLQQPIGFADPHERRKAFGTSQGHYSSHHYRQGELSDGGPSPTYASSRKAERRRRHLAQPSSHQQRYPQDANNSFQGPVSPSSCHSNTHREQNHKREPFMSSPEVPHGGYAPSLMYSGQHHRHRPRSLTAELGRDLDTPSPQQHAHAERPQRQRHTNTSNQAGYQGVRQFQPSESVSPQYTQTQPHGQRISSSMTPLSHPLAHVSYDQNHASAVPMSLPHVPSQVFGPAAGLPPALGMGMGMQLGGQPYPNAMQSVVPTQPRDYTVFSAMTGNQLETMPFASPHYPGPGGVGYPNAMPLCRSVEVLPGPGSYGHPRHPTYCKPGEEQRASHIGSEAERDSCMTNSLLDYRR